MLGQFKVSSFLRSVWVVQQMRAETRLARDRERDRERERETKVLGFWKPFILSYPATADGEHFRHFQASEGTARMEHLLRD